MTLARDPIVTPPEPWNRMVHQAVEWSVAVNGLWWAWALTAWHSHHHHAPKHHDLVVPEPIEQEGEHALFA